MIDIVFEKEALFHSLSHFTCLDKEIYHLLNEKYSEQDIVKQSKLPGSKFYDSFALSPIELTNRLQLIFPNKFSNLHPESDGRIRLSFVFDKPIGTSGVINLNCLTAEEKSTIRTENRNNCIAKTVKINRENTTQECQLILACNDSYFYFCTAFPGELAPPLPRPGEMPDPFWEKHLLIRHY